MKKHATIILILTVFFITILSIVFVKTVFGEQIEITGAGATFPYPFYSKIFNVYYEKTGVKINYQAIGSGGGIRQLLNKTVDFGATDVFISNKDFSGVNSKIIHIPTCLGAVVITYNLPGNPRLKFTPEIISDIFLGKIKWWNDQRIKDINKKIKLPKKRIVVIHRADGSGTTFILSDYLTKVSPEWAKKVGRGKILNWPSGIGGKGNTGVAGLIKKIPGAIGYVELIYALQNEMPAGLIRNKAGNFINPSIKSVSIAANINIPDDTRISITDTNSKNGYPICSFTWLIFYQDLYYTGNIQKALELVKLFWWIIHDGQIFAESLNYAPLPQSVIKKGEKILQNVLYRGKRLNTF